MIAHDNAAVCDAPFDSDTLLPDLLRKHPQARPVFDRYGLRGCGGRLGPVESIGFFARTHGVDEQQLTRELHQAISAGPYAAASTQPSVADTIYRRYFIGAITLILTAGGTWGAWILLRIGYAGKFTGVSILDINAHGHAQIFGWVGLFIMGFAYQAFPRVWHTDLVRPRWAVAAFISMAAGLIIRTIGMPAAGLASWALPAAMIGGALEIFAVLIFTTQILVTFLRSNAKLEPYVGFALASLTSFVAMSFMSVWHTWNTMSATTQQSLLWYVATYQAPLRDLQIHGLAMLMILGVSMRMLPPLFGIPAVPARRAWTALAILVTAIVGEIAIFIAYRWTGLHELAAFLLLPWLMLIIGVAMIALPWRLWRPFPEYDRSGKFVRAAYAWLAFSLLMLILLPVYQFASGIPFSHAYYGAIRHAITVGFISLMIMGFAAKVVPTLNGLETRKLSRLWGPFLMVNIGCFLRVSMQTLTDWNHIFFALVGVSGILEVSGIAWWGVALIRIMRQGKRQMEMPEEAQPACPAIPSRIELTHHVAEILSWYPSTVSVFDRHGFTMLRNPVLRRTLSRGVTVAQAAGVRGLDADELLRELNEAVVQRAN